MVESQMRRSDADIQEDIEYIIAHYPPLMNDRHHIQVTVKDGVVTASGHTRTAITRSYLVSALEQVADVTSVTASGLHSDDIIRLEIGRLIPIGVYANVDHGVVILTGRLPEGTDREQLAAAVGGVRGVRAVHAKFA